MIINKEGKLFGKISIIDILVVLAIIVAAFGVYTRFFVGNEKVQTAANKIEYKVKIQEVRIGTVNALEKYKGDVYDSNSDEYLGRIVAVEYTDSKKMVETQRGQLVEADVPEKYDCVVTIQLDGSISDAGYYTPNNRMLTAGASCNFTAKAAQTSGKIMEIYELKQ